VDAPNEKDNLRNYLAFLKEAGFIYLTPSAKKGKGGDLSAHQRAEQLEALRASAATCTRCKLCQGRTHVVFGEGNPNADLVFVGEGPGADEDAQGRPFVGRAGKLLDKMIVEVGLQREDVFICNVVKCRPPDNRDPELDEMDACEPFLKGQIALIQPKVIVTLGRFATHRLTGLDTPITKMCGLPYLYGETTLIPLLHPAAVLRNMSQLPGTIENLKRAVEIVKTKG
jgi:DNA polymerase